MAQFRLEDAASDGPERRLPDSGRLQTSPYFKLPPEAPEEEPPSRVEEPIATNTAPLTQSRGSTREEPRPTTGERFIFRMKPRGGPKNETGRTEESKGEGLNQSLSSLHAESLNATGFSELGSTVGAIGVRKVPFPPKPFGRSTSKGRPGKRVNPNSSCEEDNRVVTVTDNSVHKEPRDVSYEAKPDVLYISDLGEEEEEEKAGEMRLEEDSIEEKSGEEEEERKAYTAGAPGKRGSMKRRAKEDSRRSAPRTASVGKRASRERIVQGQAAVLAAAAKQLENASEAVRPEGMLSGRPASGTRPSARGPSHEEIVRRREKELRVQEQMRKLQHFKKVAKEAGKNEDVKRIKEKINYLKREQKLLPEKMLRELAALELFTSPYHMSQMQMIREEIERTRKRESAYRDMSAARGTSRKMRNTALKEESSSRIKELSGIYGGVGPA